jgi:hypothetical protein
MVSCGLLYHILNGATIDQVLIITTPESVIFPNVGTVPENEMLGELIVELRSAESSMNTGRFVSRFEFLICPYGVLHNWYQYSWIKEQ